MNIKAQTRFVGLMLAIVIFVLAVSLSAPTREVINDSMDQMNCTSDTISDFDKATCVVVDLSPFYFIGGLLALAGLIVGARIIFK